MQFLFSCLSPPPEVNSPSVGHPPSTVSGTQEMVNEEKGYDTDSGTAAEALANVTVV